MSDFMKQIVDLKEAEDRFKKRYESRVPISEVVDLIHDVLGDLDQRICDVNSEDKYFQEEFNNPERRSHREGKTASSDDGLKLRQTIADDVEDLMNQINILLEIVLPMSKLLKEYQRSLERLSGYYHRQSNKNPQ